MRFHYQNLKEGRSTAWSEGRWWLHFSNAVRRGLTLRAEWTVPARSWGWGITFGGEERGVQIQFTVPFLASLWLMLEGCFTRDLYQTDKGDDREIGIHLHDGAIWWHLWVGTMAAWSRSYSWCQWWRQGSWHPFGQWRHVRHSWLNPDGSVYLLHTPPDQYAAPSEISQTLPYEYVLKSGEIQERTATISGDEREWRWQWLFTLPFPRKVRRTIDVRFSDEVGEGTGSWKGGTVGCGWEWRPDETQAEALSRMERERKF